MSVLYIIACGSPAAGRVGILVELARSEGWDVCVLTTPDGRKFVDVPGLAAATGHPVRSLFKNPGDPDVLPAADAIVVAPATVNTINKWAAGIADTLPLAILIEAYGKGVPIVALPITNALMAAHPAFVEAIARLRSWGVNVLFGDDTQLQPTDSGELDLDAIPWHLTLKPLRSVDHAVDPGLDHGLNGGLDHG